MESEPGTDTKGFFGHLTPTRTLVLVILALFSVVGVVSALENSPFSMDKLVNFIEAFAYLYGPVVLGVAGGGIAKNMIQNKGTGGTASGGSASSNVGR